MQTLLVMKLLQLQRTELRGLTYGDLEGYVRSRWSRKAPLTLSGAADEIWRIRAEDVVQYLSRQAMRAKRSSAAEMFESIGGKRS